MNAQLTYWSGQSYSQRFVKVRVKVARSSSGKRVHFSFRENESGSKSYASFSLPIDKSAQLAHAILTVCAGDLLQPVEFEVDESGAVSRTAAA